MPIAVLLTIVVALAIDRLFYRPFRAGQTIMVVIASFGVALMLRSAIELFWGVETVPYHNGIERPLVFFDTLRIDQRHLWIVGGTILLGVARHLFLTRPRSAK